MFLEINLLGPYEVVAEVSMDHGHTHSVRNVSVVAASVGELYVINKHDWIRRVNKSVREKALEKAAPDSDSTLLDALEEQTQWNNYKRMLSHISRSISSTLSHHKIEQLPPFASGGDMPEYTLHWKKPPRNPKKPRQLLQLSDSDKDLLQLDAEELKLYVAPPSAHEAKSKHQTEAWGGASRRIVYPKNRREINRLGDALAGPRNKSLHFLTAREPTPPAQRRS
jgi:hypothetical protein